MAGWIAGTWMDIFGANSDSYVTNILSEGTYTYRVVVIQDSGCEAAADGVDIVVGPDVSINTQPENIIECIGGTEQMSVTISGGSGTISYQWQESTTGTSASLQTSLVQIQQRLHHQAQ